MGKVLSLLLLAGLVRCTDNPIEIYRDSNPSIRETQMRDVSTDGTDADLEEVINPVRDTDTGDSDYTGTITCEPNGYNLDVLLTETPRDQYLVGETITLRGTMVNQGKEFRHINLGFYTTPNGSIETIGSTSERITSGEEIPFGYTPEFYLPGRNTINVRVFDCDCIGELLRSRFSELRGYGNDLRGCQCTSLASESEESECYRYLEDNVTPLFRYEADIEITE